jgi:sirohydrochlorin cobaltochelatase
MRGIVLLAHGARDPEWSRPFEDIRGRIHATRPECPIALAYLELMSPTLDEAVESLIAEGALAVTVFPLFMAQGSHLKRDIPRILEAIRKAHPHVPIGLEASIGETPEILAAIAAWILARVD